MTGVYIVASEPGNGKSVIVLGVHELMARRFPRLGVFRPVVAAGAPDALLSLLRSRGVADLPYEASVGVTWEDVHADQEAAIEEIVVRYRALARQCDAVLVVGADFTNVGASGELAFNARMAADLGLPALGVVSGAGRSQIEMIAAIERLVESLHDADCDVEAVFANRVEPAIVDELAERVSGHEPPMYVLPEVGLLSAPTVEDLRRACSGELIGGDASALGLEVRAFVVASMTLPNVLDRLTEGAIVITAGDRADVILGVMMAHGSGTFPALSGVILTGGLRPADQVVRLIEGLHTTLPVVLTQHSTYPTAQLAGTTVGRITPAGTGKINTALRIFDEHADRAQLLDRIATAHPEVCTPLMFQYALLDRARAERKRIVLPEGTEDRVLRAADILLRRDVVDLTLLGDPTAVRGRATQLQLDISAATVIDPNADELRERFAEQYAIRRAGKGVTADGARDTVTDVSYFGTMMVALDLVDGMVSGAVHTTAATIRPAFELIKARPGVSRISSVFFMCLHDRVLVYGDCAVNPDPGAEDLADIAISSAQTASQFGIEPRVAMLSYSTGPSDRGAGVEKVRAATAIIRTRAPELSVEGPIQYDAAIDLAVARSKLPGSEVAGRATVFIFPDLNTGNNTYKAVQRSARAVAIGPVLQGLRKPVNDLSRGALVQDIVNTVAITAIQAQDYDDASLPTVDSSAPSATAALPGYRGPSSVIS
ncbi:MAG: phosphate acetyltransferase [Solirubrobacteraceae bacterium]